MKKILIADSIFDLIPHGRDFFGRANVRLLRAETKEAALQIHKAEKVNLIIMDLDAPGMSCEEFCAVIRTLKDLRKVSIMLLCNNSKDAMERSSRCQANFWTTRPIDEEVFLEKAHQLMNISTRQDYRVLLSVVVSSRIRKKSFFCRSENISASGMLLETDKLLSRGDRLTCSFFLPDSVQIVAEGEIVRIVKRSTEVEPNQYGLRFTQIETEAKEAIEKFVRLKAHHFRS